LRLLFLHLLVLHLLVLHLLFGRPQMRCVNAVALGDLAGVSSIAEMTTAGLTTATATTATAATAARFMRAD
jgi:hypothetical protein